MSPSVISPVEKVSSLLLDTRWVSAWEKSYSTTFKVQKYFLSFFYKNCSWRKICYHVWFFFQTQNSSEIIVCVLWIHFFANSKSILWGRGKDYKNPIIKCAIYFQISLPFDMYTYSLCWSIGKNRQTGTLICCSVLSRGLSMISSLTGFDTLW